MKTLVIYLICTRHENLGSCNSRELYNIFERIKPEVIFDETPPSYFDIYYVDKKRSNLESTAINLYKQEYGILNIPVDSDEVPDQSFFDEFQKLHLRIERLSDKDGFNYRNLTDRNIENSAIHGFQYLNSDSANYFYNEIKLAIESGLKTLDNENLDSIYKNWQQLTNKREDTMLKNIYEYSEKYPFDCAIFTVGTAHRESIIEKINIIRRTQDIQLDWRNI